MNNNRRKFIRITSALTAGSILLPNIACRQKAKEEISSTIVESPALVPSLKEFGIQLYSLREDMPKDPKSILSQVASFGYKQIESYEGDQGMFWNMSHTDFKKYLDDLNLNLISSHCNINENFEEKAAQAGEIGMKYLVCPYVGPQKSLDDFKRLSDQFNECGVICQKNGLRFAYHNHAYSFAELEGQRPQDFMMANTDPELVDFQMDIYWVVTGGADPVEYLKKYANRFKLCHVKDRIKDTPLDQTDASCDLGTGSIDYPKILNIAEQNGMEYYILEQERYDNSTPLKSAEADAIYLKNLIFS